MAAPRADASEADDDRQQAPHRRFLLQVPAEVFVGSLRGCVRGALVDLSLTGAFTILYEKVEFEGRAWVQFMCNDQWCQARGRVEHTVPMARALGIRIAFSGHDEAFAATLRDWSSGPFSAPTRLARIREVRITLR